MDKAQQLAEQWEDILLQTQHEFELMLQDITTSRPSLDHLLLGRVTMHHMSQLHESIAALSKALETYWDGTLDDCTILALAQWS